MTKTINELKYNFENTKSQREKIRIINELSSILYKQRSWIGYHKELLHFLINKLNSNQFSIFNDLNEEILKGIQKMSDIEAVLSLLNVINPDLFFKYENLIKQIIKNQPKTYRPDILKIINQQLEKDFTRFQKNRVKKLRDFYLEYATKRSSLLFNKNTGFPTWLSVGAAIFGVAVIKKKFDNRNKGGFQ
jgi:uncharacterized coiled-coil protein SlyX